MIINLDQIYFFNISIHHRTFVPSALVDQKKIQEIQNDLSVFWEPTSKFNVALLKRVDG
jgi:hypothetical protein